MRSRRSARSPRSLDFIPAHLGDNPSLAQVAAATGSANQSHFTTVFRRLVGMTPKRYRDRV